MLACIAIVNDADNLLPIFVEFFHVVFVSNSYAAFCRPSSHFFATLHEIRKENMKRCCCTSCGQFVGASHVCSRDIDRELQSDEPGILYKIPDISISVSPVARSETLNCLSTLGLTAFSVSPDISIANDSIIFTLRPARVTAIRGDGNCLFSSLAVALGLTEDCRAVIRNIIVSNMLFINFPQNNLQTSITSNDFPNQHRVLNCSSVEEYLRISKMSESGIYGTCVEIYAFCQIFQLDVYLYHVSLKA